MILSMTGFGIGHYEDSSVVIDVELKSFNSRYFELNTRSFDLSGESEYKIRTFLKNKLKRGSINLTVKIDSKNQLKPGKYTIDGQTYNVTSDDITSWKIWNQHQEKYGEEAVLKLKEKKQADINDYLNKIELTDDIN